MLHLCNRFSVTMTCQLAYIGQSTFLMQTFHDALDIGSCDIIACHIATLLVTAHARMVHFSMVT